MPDRPSFEADPLTEGFWDAARERTLTVWRCSSCGQSQLPPRPFCLSCSADQVSWKPASGKATVYSQATVQVQVIDGLEPPYTIALVDLDEGPRMLTHIVGEPVEIGAEVEVDWIEREGGAPPLPVFRGAGR